MKIGIVGPASAGKTTLFRLLTGAAPARSKGGLTIGTAHVPDERLDRLSAVFKGKKTVYAALEFCDLPPLGAKSEISGETAGKLKSLDALTVVVRAHRDPTVPWPGEPVAPDKAFSSFQEEMILTDLLQLDKILGRKKDKGRSQEETAFLEKCQSLLEEMKPLSSANWDAGELPCLRNYAFLSSRPVLVAVNIDEEQLQDHIYDGQRELLSLCEKASYPVIEFCGTLEIDISEMDKEEQAEYLAAYGLKQSGIARLAAAAYRLLDLISFFTVGEDEVRAWTVKNFTPAKKAAGKVHSDMERGFIRAEVINFAEFMSLGASLKIARELGKLRLEGKDYPVCDGDIINFRFNV